MNEEEKEAIEDLRGYLEWNDERGFTRLPRDNHIEIGLNLIFKQQKELDKKDKLYNKALTDLVKAEKVIDLITEEIEQLYEIVRDKRTKKIEGHKKENIKQYYVRKVEEENE